MYLDYYGFSEKPFNLTPDPYFVFLSKNHKEAFAHLLYGINNRTGFIALTGEVGSGKTTVLRSLLSQLDADNYRTALIFNPSLSPRELLQSINREFGVSTDNQPGLLPLDALNQFLLRQNAEGRTVVLVIDEAQDLETEALEQIRLISNLETDKEKLIQIVLSGQPELVQILEKKEMRQLSQRITVRYHLQPLDFEDTVRYVDHRLKLAGKKGGLTFSRGAMKRIYGYSRGLPRLINAACDRSLLAGFTGDTAMISSRVAAAGIRDLIKKADIHSPKRRFILVPAFVMFAVLIAAGVYLTREDIIDLFPVLQRRETAAEQTKKGPVVSSEDFFLAMAVELGKVPKSESAGRAFNNLAGLWKVPSFSESGIPEKLDGAGHAALERDLQLSRFYGNLGALLRFDYPVILELNIPGITGKRFITLMRRDNDQILVDPPVAGKGTLILSELEKYWSGWGIVFWKDHLNLHAGTSPGSKGGRIKQLQGLLKEAGFYNGTLTGVYDGYTVRAVKEFQMSKGIREDGIAGNQTLMLLYGCVDRFGAPRLTAGRK